MIARSKVLKRVGCGLLAIPPYLLFYACVVEIDQAEAILVKMQVVEIEQSIASDPNEASSPRIQYLIDQLPQYHLATYPWGGVVSQILCYPIHLIDRTIRPEVWAVLSPSQDRVLRRK